MNGFYLHKIAIIGVGLIGGSFALALKRAGVVATVSGWDADSENLRQAHDLQVIDQLPATLQDAVHGAELVMLAVPVGAMEAAARQVIPSMDRGAILTDSGSVKQCVLEALEPLAVAQGVRYVAGHPISGTERSGAAAAFAELYQGKRCILTPSEQTDVAALDVVTRAWQAAGSVVVTMDVYKHDRILAAISHLPHMIAYSLVNSVSAYDRYEENILDYSAGGFRDFTRIASSDPIMWRDIALTNRDSLIEMIDQFENFLSELKNDIQQADGEKLYEFFLRSKITRDALLQPKVR